MVETELMLNMKKNVRVGISYTPYVADKGFKTHAFLSSSEFSVLHYGAQH